MDCEDGLLDTLAPLEDALEEGEVRVEEESEEDVPDLKHATDVGSSSAEQVEKHRVTHLPYRSWCPHCLAARRPNSRHLSSTSQSGRTVHIFVADYCFTRKPEEELLTGLVGKLYPNHAIFASICDAKGPDDSVVDRLAEFFRNTGIPKLVYKQDQEPAIRNAIERALTKVGRHGEPIPDEQLIQMIPEFSAVGQSPSNGRAERAVQSVEDMVRTYLSASNIDSRRR